MWWTELASLGSSISSSSKTSLKVSGCWGAMAAMFVDLRQRDETTSVIRRSSSARGREALARGGALSRTQWRGSLNLWWWGNEHACRYGDTRTALPAHEWLRYHPVTQRIVDKGYLVTIEKCMKVRRGRFEGKGEAGGRGDFVE